MCIWSFETENRGKAFEAYFKNVYFTFVFLLRADKTTIVFTFYSQPVVLRSVNHLFSFWTLKIKKPILVLKNQHLQYYKIEMTTPLIFIWKR